MLNRCISVKMCKLISSRQHIELAEAHVLLLWFASNSLPLPAVASHPRYSLLPLRSCTSNCLPPEHFCKNDYNFATIKIFPPNLAKLNSSFSLFFLNVSLSNIYFINNSRILARGVLFTSVYSWPSWFIFNKYFVVFWHKVKNSLQINSNDYRAWCWRYDDGLFAHIVYLHVGL